MKRKIIKMYAGKIVLNNGTLNRKKQLYNTQNRKPSSLRKLSTNSNRITKCKVNKTKKDINKY